MTQFNGILQTLDYCLSGAKKILDQLSDGGRIITAGKGFGGMIDDTEILADKKIGAFLCSILKEVNGVKKYPSRAARTSTWQTRAYTGFALTRLTAP